MEEPMTDVRVTLVGEDGNAHYILGKDKRALIDAGHRDLAEQYIEAATSGDYDHLLQTTLRFVHVD